VHDVTQIRNTFRSASHPIRLFIPLITQLSLFQLVYAPRIERFAVLKIISLWPVWQAIISLYAKHINILLSFSLPLLSFSHHIFYWRTDIVVWISPMSITHHLPITTTTKIQGEGLPHCA